MSDATVVAVLGVLGSLVVALLGTQWLNRRNIARLTNAQASNSEATTIEISDRIARGWIQDLDKKLSSTNQRLDEEVVIRRGAIAYIERILDWIKESGVETESLPPLPDSLKAYVTTPQ